MSEAIKYINSLGLFTDTWETIAVSLSIVLGYFTLSARLGDALANMGPYLVISDKKCRVDSVRRFMITMRCALLISTFSTALLITRLLFKCSGTSEEHSACAYLTFFLSIFTFTGIIALTAIGFLAESNILKWKKYDINWNSLQSTSVLYLNCGNIIKGRILNIKIKRKPFFLDVLLENGTITHVDSRQVALIYFQAEYASEKVFQERRFREGPRSIKIIYPHPEEFPDAKYYDKGGFKIIRINKASTNSRFVISKKENIGEESHHPASSTEYFDFLNSMRDIDR